MTSTKQQIIKAAIVVLLTATAFNIKAQEKSVRLDPVNERVYRLTYRDNNVSRVKIEVLNSEGRVIQTDMVQRSRSFIRPYNFEYLPNGQYAFKVTDRDGEYLAFLDRSGNKGMQASIQAVEQNKAKVVVRGEASEPVHVRVLDHKGELVFDDEIKTGVGFSRLYDLSKVSARYLKMEVSSGVSLLASAELK